MVTGAPPPPASTPSTVSILRDYIDALAENGLIHDLRRDDLGGVAAQSVEALTDPRFGHEQRLALSRTCLLRLNQARTAGIVGLLERAVGVLDDVGVARDDDRREEGRSRSLAEEIGTQVARSSGPLAELLRLQLVSESEAGLYGVCRVAWDHAHVGERVVGLLEELGRLEWDEEVGRRMDGVRRGLGVLTSTNGMGGIDCSSVREEEGLGEDEAFVGVVEREVVENLEKLVRLARLVGGPGGENVGEGGEGGAVRGELGELEGLARGALVECIAKSVVFEKGGLPKPRRAVRLRALLRAGVALDGLGGCEVMSSGDDVVGVVGEASKRLAEVVYGHSVRKVLITFGDAGGKHPVGYREKVVLKVMSCLKEDTLFGDTTWVEAVGRELWGLMVGFYVEEWEEREERLGGQTCDKVGAVDAVGAVDGVGAVDMVDEAMLMKRMAFAKKLESRVAALFGISDEGRLGAASGERVRKIMGRRRAATVCAVRDALFGVSVVGAVNVDDVDDVDDLVGVDGASYRVIHRGDPLALWGHSTQSTRESHPFSDGQQQSMLDIDVVSELQSMDAPLSRAEIPLVVFEGHVVAMERLAAALEEHAGVLTDGQYAVFVGSLAEDVASLLVALVELRGEHWGETDHSHDNTNNTHDAPDPLVRSLWKTALEYMSCVYVARSLCLMRFGYGVKPISAPIPALDASCRRIATLGERVLGERLGAFRRSYLVDHLESLTSWRQHVDVQDIIAKKKSVSRLLHVFGELGKNMSNDANSNSPRNDKNDTLSTQEAPMQLVSSKIVTDMMEWVADVILDSILGLRDISEELSEAIVQVLDEFAEGMMAAIRVCDAMPVSLQRLREVCRVMSMTSSEIVTGFQDGVIGQVFDRDEVIGLIEALFERTPAVEANLGLLGGLHKP